MMDQTIRNMLMKMHPPYVIARYCGVSVGYVKRVRRAMLNVESVAKPPRPRMGPPHWYDTQRGVIRS